MPLIGGEWRERARRLGLSDPSELAVAAAIDPGLLPGDGSVRAAETKAPLNRAQTETYQQLARDGHYDNGAEMGSERRPYAQLSPEDQPAPGTWTCTGRSARRPAVRRRSRCG